MLKHRVIPCILLKDWQLVKSINFDSYRTIGHPTSTARIYNSRNVDELIVLDIDASLNDDDINVEIITDIANECFMPLGYGGNIKSLDDAKRIFEIGFEKVIINSNSFNNLKLIEKISKYFGSQSIIGSVDIKKSFWGGQKIYSHHGRIKQKDNAVTWAKKLEDSGVGELLITSIDREGSWSGYDIDLIESINKVVQVPIIANGGCGSVQHIEEVVKKANVSACAVGSLVVYQKKGMGVLVNFPCRKDKLLDK